MSYSMTWMQSEWAIALGWTFVHSLWQIALIGLLLYVVLRRIPGRSAHTRYTISTFALWMVVIVSLSTFLIMLPDNPAARELSGTIIVKTVNQPLSLTQKISIWLEVRMPLMLSIWSGGVALLMLRLALSLAWVRHMRTTATPEIQIQEVLDAMISRLKLKVKPGTSGSGLVSSPVTIGHFKPLILFPIGIINQLSPAEVEAILTHELAHIARRDYLSNLIQSVIETIFYYHPITWWISGMVRTERENRADDLAVKWCGDHLEYAKALMTVQEMQARQTPSLAIGFASRKGAMLARIQRILNVPYKNHNQMEKTVLLSLSSLCFLAFTVTTHTPKTTADDLVTKTINVTVDVPSKQDSIPAEGTYRIHKKTDTEDISVEVENGDIKQLKVDGKEIQPSEYNGYSQVIEELFGSMEAPAMVQGFNITIPDLPAIPNMPNLPQGIYFEMPELPEMPEIPEMPEMPEIPNIELEKYLEGARMMELQGLDGLNGLAIGGNQTIRIMADSASDGMARMIIITNGDTSLITSKEIEIMQGQPFKVELGSPIENQEEWKAMQDAWREQTEAYRKQQQVWREQSRAQQDAMRQEQNQLRKEYRGQLSWSDEDQRAMERDLGLEQGTMLRYIVPTPRLSLSDQMVQDGLVEPGTEVEVQLTPDKLKINGEKMPESVHQKYLKLYEQQQGVELSGNSRVEFTTKSKQRM